MSLPLQKGRYVLARGGALFFPCRRMPPHAERWLTGIFFALLGCRLLPVVQSDHRLVANVKQGVTSTCIPTSRNPVKVCSSSPANWKFRSPCWSPATPISNDPDASFAKPKLSWYRSLRLPTPPTHRTCHMGHTRRFRRTRSSQATPLRQRRPVNASPPSAPPALARIAPPVYNVNRLSLDRKE